MYARVKEGKTLMAKEKRQRTDSVAGALASMSGGMRTIDVPDWVILPNDALPFWRSITSARAAERWNNSDLETAAELARTKAKIERLNIELEQEGDIITNERGTPIVNPKNSLLETLTRRLVALSRMLQVHAEATQGKSRDQVPANKAQAAAAQVARDMEGEDLIARPTH